MELNIKSYFLLLSLSFCLILLPSCTAPSEQKSNPTNQNTEILNIHQLNDQQQEDWNALFKDWQINHFKNCLEANNFEQNCFDCGSIYLDGVFTVGKNGKLLAAKIINEEIDCLQAKSPQQIQQLKECMMFFFNKHAFPSSLRNLSVNARIGRLTKC